MKKRLTNIAIEKLRAIPMQRGSLFDHIDSWMKAGLLLRDLDEKRTDILKTLGLTETKQADVARARNEWIRGAHTLRSTLELARATPEDVERVFRYVDQDLAKLARSPARPGSKIEKPRDSEAEEPNDEPPLASAPPDPASSPCASHSEKREPDTP